MAIAKGRSWIVEFWCRVFHILGRISLFEMVRKVAPTLRRNYAFVEIYVFTNTTLAFLALAIASWRSDMAPTLLLVMAAVYGAYRIFEITVYQINVLMFDDYKFRKLNGPKAEYSVRSYRRMVILLVHNYFEIVLWYGLVYIYLYRSERIGTLTPDPSFLEIFRESMLLMFSFNTYRYQPSGDLAVLAFSTQAIVGLFMTLMVFARFLALLPAPKSMDDFEQE